ncbi:MAG: hypothetical protein WCA44_18025 [Acidobacteriaceae bacterium]
MAACADALAFYKAPARLSAGKKAPGESVMEIANRVYDATLPMPEVTDGAPGRDPFYQAAGFDFHDLPREDAGVAPAGVQWDVATFWFVAFPGIVLIFLVGLWTVAAALVRLLAGAL